MDAVQAVRRSSVTGPYPSTESDIRITDIYLVGLCRKHKGKLATFDRSIPLRAVLGAKPDLIECLGELESTEFSPCQVNFFTTKDAKVRKGSFAYLCVLCGEKFLEIK